MDRYDLLTKLSEGGMGEVFLARITGEHGFKKLVAVKRIRSELSSDEEFYLRFVTEAKVTVSLNHANIVQVFDLARAGEDLYLVMEYVRGADLNYLFRRADEQHERIPLPALLHIAAEALKGLAYAHGRRTSSTSAKGIIHCDISPSNLLVSHSGEVKIADFGIAQAMAKRQTADHRAIGKKGYMSPEQQAGQVLDARTDLYSLAMVLRKGLLTGIENATWPPPDVPAELISLLEKATAQDPKRRPESAVEVLKSISELSRRLAVLTPPEVGAWVARLSPNSPEHDQDDFGHAIGDLLGASPPQTAARTKEKSNDHTGVTFVARSAVQGGPTLWEAVAEKAVHKGLQRKRVGWAIAAGALLLMLLGGALWLSNRQTQEQVAQGSEPLRASVAPVPAANPEPTPTVAKTLTPAAQPSKDPESSSRSTSVAMPRRKAAPGYLNIFADPWANVVIDGRSVGTTPLRGLALPPGQHKIRLVHPNRQTVERRVKISSGKTDLVDVELKSIVER